MSSSNMNHVLRVLVGSGANTGTASVPGIQKGDLLVLDENGLVITTVAQAAALSKNSPISIAFGLDTGVASVGPQIVGALTEKYIGQSFVAPVEQELVIGYNGTASTGISIVADTEYRLRTLIKDQMRINGMRPTISDVNYTASSADTPETVAFQINCLYDSVQFQKNFMSDKVMLNRTSNGTTSALPGTTADLINGSDIVTSTAHALNVGDQIRVGGTSGILPNYIVTEVVDANNFKIDIAWNGDTASYTSFSVATVTEWGFRLRGIPQESRVNRNGNDPYNDYGWILFDAVFTDADDLASSQYSATKLETQSINPGQGYWKQVAEAEANNRGNKGELSRRSFDSDIIDNAVVKGTTYNSIFITYGAENRSLNGGLVANLPLQIALYLPVGSNQGDDTPANNEFLALLNSYFGTVSGFTPIAF